MEKALTDVRVLLISEEGPVAIKSDGKVLNMDESIQVVSSGEFDGEPIKAEYIDLLGDNYQNVDLATVSAILFASLMLFEKEKELKVSIKERHGFLDIRVDETAINMEKLVFRVSKYFPDVFVLFSNIGYYESLLEFGIRFELIKREADSLILNEDVLNHLVKKHSAFETFCKKYSFFSFFLFVMNLSI